MRTLLLLIFVFSCSTTDKSNQSSLSLRNSDFVKKKSAKKNEFKDYILTSSNKGSVFLQDESIDFLNQAQLEQIVSDNKDILELSLLCSHNENKKFDQFVDLYFSSYSKIPSFWNTIGNCYLKKGNLKKALMFYNKALEIDSGYYPTLNNLGVFYLRQFNYQKALLAFEKANQLSTFSKTPKYNLVTVYLKFGLVDKARKLLIPLLTEFPQEKRLIKLNAYLNYADGDYENSIKYFSALNGSKVLNDKDYLYLAFSHFKLGSLDKSRGILRSINKKELDSSSQKFFNFLTSKVGESL